MQAATGKNCCAEKGSRGAEAAAARDHHEQSQTVRQSERFVPEHTYIIILVRKSLKQLDENENEKDEEEEVIRAAKEEEGSYCHC